MRALAITPGKPGVRLVERPEPKLAQRNEVKLRVLRVGICGTDREEIRGGRAGAPAGQSELVIGHEMLGEVVAVGDSVRRVQPGERAVFTVRRGCNACANCAMNRADMCQTGNYHERGIQGLDGYQTEFVVDAEENLVPVPAELGDVGVLLEPLSIVEKAIAEALAVQRRRDPVAAITPDWLHGRRCLVAGLGPVGLLAAMALHLRGGDVFGMDVVNAASARPQRLEALGGRYVDGRSVPADKVAQTCGGMDLILDASGVASLEFNLLDALAANGIYVLTGIPGGDHPLQIPGADLVRRLVLGNQAMLGSVNAARGHFQLAADDLVAADRRWPGWAPGLITHAYSPEEFAAAAETHPSADAIKEAVVWGT